MSKPTKHLRIGISLAALCILFLGVGCEIYVDTPAGAFLGRAGRYDYSPSAIQFGNVQQFWWCGEAFNPDVSSQDTDTILYATYDLATKRMSVPKVVLAETPGAWDSAFTCNPKTIAGTFVNPLGDGVTYTYAIYYVATSSPAGIANNIGVAFSKDGMTWKKYPQPVILTTTQGAYGVGQPAVYNSDGKSGVWVFYEDLNGITNSHYKATSTDGVHFTTQGQLTTNGLDMNLLDGTWGDMAYDSVAGYWYALYNIIRRDPSTTGNILELGEPGIALYRIPNASLLTGASPWELLKSFDTNLTGHESNFLGGFLRDVYGNLNIGAYPTLQIYTSMSNPAPSWDSAAIDAGKSADPQYWDIGSVQWVPGDQVIPFNQYQNPSIQESTTGWVDPAGGFTLTSVLGHLYAGPQQGATVPLYGCKSGTNSYSTSTDSTCAGSLLLGIDGYAFPNAQAGANLVPIYSCGSNPAHPLSTSASCAGGPGQVLAYALP
jgi:hypothetical protein